MRPVGLGDLVAAARALAAVPRGQRRAVMAQMLSEAEAADTFRRREGRLHPRYGNGTLMAVALARPQGGRTPGEVQSLACLAQALEAVLCWSGGTAPAKIPGGWQKGRDGLFIDPDRAPQEAAMPDPRSRLSLVDPVWERICSEAQRVVVDEPLLGGMMHTNLLHHPSMERALAFRFAQKLASAELGEQILREIADEAYEADPSLGEAARADLVAVHDRDPACHRFVQPILYFKGYQAVQAYRIGHWLWLRGRVDMASFVQMRVSEAFGVDIHPGARIGKGIMIDHAHSIVIGETAVVGDNVSMLHSVTLGGTGKTDGDRHPKIGDGVLIGAGAKVLGNIRIGRCTRIAAGSVVLSDVPACKTVAGVPARIVGEAGCEQPALSMNHRIEG